MSQPRPVDVFDKEIHRGDWVCYTTNAEGGGFDFGYVDKINEQHGTRHDGTPTVSYRLVMLKTDQYRNPEYYQDWDSVARKNVPTDKQTRSGQVQYSAWKFMIIP